MGHSRTPLSCRHALAAFVCVIGLWHGGYVCADVFALTAEDGSLQYGDRAPDTRWKLWLRTESTMPSPETASVADFAAQASPRPLDTEVTAAALHNRVEPALLHALVEIESGYNPNAISPKGALGLTQLMPATARRYGVLKPLDVAQNLQGGARHLRYLLDIFSGNLELALAAYNAGVGAVQAHGYRIPPYRETRRYVPEVLRRYEQLRNTTSTRAPESPARVKAH